MDNVFLDFDGLSRFKDKLDEKTAETVETLVPKTEFESFKDDVQDDINGLADHVSDTYAKKDGDYETLGAGSATNLKGNTVSNAKFAFRTAGGSADIATGQAQLNVVRGNTVVWNQYIPSNITYTESGITFTTTNGKMNVSGTATHTYVRFVFTAYGPLISGHKFAFISKKKTSGLPAITLWTFNADNSQYNTCGENMIATFTHVGGSFQIRLTTTEGQSYSGSVYLQLFDLTLMFGAGNEPTSIAEFEKMYPMDYYPYSAPTLLSFRADGIKTVGFNQFNYATGKAKVIPNMEYQITGAFTSLSMNGETITPDSDGIFTPTQYGEVEVTGGNTNTCIHLVWSGKRNGEFEEYWESKLAHPLTQLTGKLNGEGESVVVFPDGLRSAGTAHDEIVGNKAIKRIGSVDLGTLTFSYTHSPASGIYAFSAITVPNLKWIQNTSKLLNGVIASSTWKVGTQSQHAKTLYNVSANNNGHGLVLVTYTSSSAREVKSALNGVILYYELETPQEYILDDFQLPAGYRVDDFGTEEIYVNEGMTTPCDLDVVYGINAADAIRRLPTQYISVESMENFLAVLGEQMGGQWEMTLNGDKYNFSFTQSSEEPDENPES